jgi:hypothetical protein
MKTTLDLPDDLMRQIKIDAAQEQMKLKELVADLLRRGRASRQAASRKPFIPKPLRLRGGFKPDVDDIEAAIASGRDE